MVSLFFCIVKLSIVIGIQAKVLKHDLLPIGSRCSSDSDCYTIKCSLTTGKSFKRCIAKDQKTPLSSRSNPTICILTGHYCTANDDCCSTVCKHIASTKLNYCQTQGNDLPFNNSYGSTTPEPSCLSNGNKCFDDSECCSHKCFYYFGSYKTICMPGV